MLSGLTVIEYADETAEYCGLLLAGLGAEVIKIEPPGGATTRSIAPFEGDTVDKERSLYFCLNSHCPQTAPTRPRSPPSAATSCRSLRSPRRATEKRSQRSPFA